MHSGLLVGVGGMRSHPLYHVRIGGTSISHLSALGALCMVALAVLGVLSSWGVGSLCSDLFLTLSIARSCMLVYTSSKLVPGIFILQLFKAYFYDWSVWNGLWRRKLILSLFNVRFSVYFKSVVYKMINLLLIPWQVFSFFLIRYGVWLDVGWGWLSKPGYCIYLYTNWDWYPPKSKRKFNSIAVKGAPLHGASFCS